MAVLERGGADQAKVDRSKDSLRVSLYKPDGDIYTLRGTSGVLAAALAVDAPVFGFRHAAVPTKNIWVMKIDIGFSATVSFTAASQGGWYMERFSAANLAGGTSELANIFKLDPASDPSEIQDVRRSTTAALTVAGVTFDAIKIPLITYNQPLVNTGPPARTVFDASEVGPIKITAGMGLAIRNLVVWPAAGTGVLDLRVSIIERLITDDDDV